MRYILIILLFSGCYNQRKAQQQVTRAVIQYPIIVATIARDQFPCVTNTDTVTTYTSDSTFYNQVTGLLESELQNTYALQDSLLKALESGDTACKKYESVISTLQKQNVSLKNRLKNIPAIRDTFKITLPPVKDMAAVRACEIVRDQAVQLATDKTAEAAKHKKGKKNWMLLSFGLLLAAGVFTYFKVKGLFIKK